ncbi:DNA polymerase III delta prime subunit [hydrothermal vent metagenome]|uniref:DNA polymerase III subunit delta' n=1 Tax=hydrothermal vent metagenome TaxID=652676 RepID=A0A3B1ADW9_9ZZZZ
MDIQESNTIQTIYPWQFDAWNRLTSNTKNNRVAHALLISGAKGVGKYHFATAFKNAMLCSDKQTDGLACGKCRYCKMQQHPDFYEITQEVDERTNKKSNVIKIDQIRKLIDFTLLHTHFGMAKIIIIHPAEAMNKSASNALLKILEEPPQDTYFVLISDQIQQLSATIRSRCQIINIQQPDIDTSMQWLNSQNINDNIVSLCLELAYNSPLTAKMLAETNYIEQHTKLIKNLLSISSQSEDPMVVANSWLKIDTNVPLHALYSCLSDLILLKSMENNPKIINNINRDSLQNIANNVSFTGLYVILDKIVFAKHQIQSNVAILGIYEDILNLWQRLTSKIIQ